jgi:hypothetical protein
LWLGTWEWQDWCMDEYTISKRLCIEKIGWRF